ncbi:MAG TPA: T9SS type A sorting domain-containing protein, partial [Bacteroidales bacterium]|nr:T9SS type A sorting domain-containing protein [Bacteroidales bacterium]
LNVKLENDNIIENLSVYPNPFTEQYSVFINSDYSERIKVSVINVAGSTVYQDEKNIISGDNTIVLSGTDLKPGTYFLNIKGNTINKTIPIVKMNR